MADNEQTTITLNDAFRTDDPSSGHTSNSQRQHGTTYSVDEDINHDEYITQLRNEIRELRKYKQQMESGSTQPPVTGVVTSSVSSTQVTVTLPFVSQLNCSQGMSHQFFMPFASFGQSDCRIPVSSFFQMSDMRFFKTFMACKPSNYYGSSNPSVTLDWLGDVERKFEICRCEEEFKVLCAIQLLKGQAKIWWDLIATILTPQQRELIRWPDFYIMVCKQFCSDYEMTRIRHEFIDLRKRDDLGIDELIVQFLETLRFVQQWIPEDITMIEQFVETLPTEYRNTVRLAESLSQAFNLARAVDSNLKARGLLNKNRNLRNQISRKDKPKWCSRCMSKHGRHCTIQTYRCIKCGEFSHEEKDCNYLNYVCWNCKMEGHQASQCPEARRQGRCMVGDSSSSGRKRKSASSPVLQMVDDEDSKIEEMDTGMFPLILF